MSRFHEEEITCPQCGKTSRFKVWDSVNTQTDEDMKAAVRSLEAFTMHCPHCGYEHVVSYNFLYHDMEEAVMIYHAADETGEETARQAFKQAMAVLHDAAHYVCRIVHSFDEMLEKLRIADAGLDDRIIALLKLLAERQVEAQYPEFHTTGCYFIRDEEGKFIIHLIDDTTNEALNVDYEASFAELYETLRNEFGKELEEQSKDVPVIDKAWAVLFLDAVMK